MAKRSVRMMWGVLYFVASCAQVLAIIDVVPEYIDVSTGLQILIALAVAEIPFVGTAAAVYGAYVNWDLPVFAGLALFIWPIVILLVYLLRYHKPVAAVAESTPPPETVSMVDRDSAPISSWMANILKEQVEAEEKGSRDVSREPTQEVPHGSAQEEEDAAASAAASAAADSATNAVTDEVENAESTTNAEGEAKEDGSDTLSSAGAVLEPNHKISNPKTEISAHAADVEDAVVDYSVEADTVQNTHFDVAEEFSDDGGEVDNDAEEVDTESRERDVETEQPSEIAQSETPKNRVEMTPEEPSSDSLSTGDEFVHDDASFPSDESTREPTVGSPISNIVQEPEPEAETDIGSEPDPSEDNFNIVSDAEFGNEPAEDPIPEPGVVRVEERPDSEPNEVAESTVDPTNENHEDVPQNGSKLAAYALILAFVESCRETIVAKIQAAEIPTLMRQINEELPALFCATALLRKPGMVEGDLVDRVMQKARGNESFSTRELLSRLDDRIDIYEPELSDPHGNSGYLFARIVGRVGDGVLIRIVNDAVADCSAALEAG